MTINTVVEHDACAVDWPRERESYADKSMLRSWRCWKKLR